MTNKAHIRILVLDDEPFMLKLMGRMLKNLGFASVMTCDTGRAALELVDRSNSRPDLILLDINMPEMDGVEFARHLVEHRYSGALILVSGEDERVLQSVDKLIQAHQITTLGYLTKPIAPEQLAMLIEKWVPQCAIQIPEKIYTASELRAAIDNGELINYYQPKVAVASAEVVGMETLVRWLHPKDGIVFPDQFIGIAEQHGLIDDLTRVVLTAALAQARIWRDAGLGLRVAVNLSMDNLGSLDFFDCVSDLTADAGVLPQDIVLEVTESRLMHDQRVLLEILTRLRLKRFRLSIDDFGTGHSSLSQLRDMPFDELKIDQGFVHGAWANETQRALFDASLGLAKQLGMDAVAEGVEDREDWDFLRLQSCDMAQGYFIAKPMTAGELPAWMAAWELRIPEFIQERRDAENLSPSSAIDAGLGDEASTSESWTTV
jgi:EAL domain-containing protein (putative c-di-GMP-specific phosphodiesterase class I)/FixJ family two-component response regulator